MPKIMFTDKFAAFWYFFGNWLTYVVSGCGVLIDHLLLVG